jgi:chaperone BCS1
LIVDCFFYLYQQPAWGRSREFEITTRSVGRLGITQSTTGDLEDEEDEDSLVHGRKKRKVAFMPSAGNVSRGIFINLY